MSIHSGKLVILQTKSGDKVMLSRETKNGWQNFPVPLAQLSKELEKWRGPGEQPVEFELQSGQIRCVRVAGKPWAPSTALAPERATPQRTPRNEGRRNATQTTARGERPVGVPVSRPEFHNPYNFVPAPPRKHVTGELGDRSPTPHDRYVSGYCSGHVTIQMTTETPVIIPDTTPGRVAEDDEGHKIFDALQRNGKPYIPPSSVRGMLRSAYEAATNSRFGVFVGHDRRLGLRMAASGGLNLVPARVQNGELMLLAGSEPLNGGPANHMRAAWIPAYTHGRVIVAPGNDPPQHGQEIWCFLQKVRRWALRENRQQGTGKYSSLFTYWRMIRAVSEPSVLGSLPTPTADPDPSYVPDRRNPPSYHQDLSDILGPVKGWACVTNQNIGSKHDERLFFSIAANPPTVPLTGALRRQWRELIQDYQDIHKGDLEKRARRGQPPQEFLGRNPGQTAWSRHVYETEVNELQDGDLCHAAVESSGGGWAAKALYPVMISRSLHPVTPAALVPPSLLPAGELAELSPADRVFGWVRGQGTGAYRGNLSIGEVECQDENAIEQFSQALPLAILGQPKPHQARFYVARDNAGVAQPDRLAKAAAGYDQPQTKGLRGRKVYPHHRGLPAGYWDEPLQDRTQESRSGYFQEYRRPHKGSTQRVRGKDLPVPKDDGGYELLEEEQRDDQNRSIRGWVKPGKKFDFDITFANLSKVELGALLWLLNQPQGRFFRLGSGKPLGFGSVHLKVVSLRARSGELMKERYQSLGTYASSVISEPHEFITAYVDAVTNSYGAGLPFEQVSFIAAICRAMEGFIDGLPIHYPRVRQPHQFPDKPVPPHPDGLGYEWFAENERERTGAYLCLRDLATDAGLPFFNKR